MNLNGVILIDKEKGISSFGVIAKLRKILGIKKIGHSGTLDPLATGLLPILIGNATKTSKYLIEHDKVYIAKIKFGIKTKTADEEGEVISRDDFKLSKKSNREIKEEFDSFLGKSKQLPPMYSAIKVDGRKLYEYARENKEVIVNKRDIEIFNIEIIKINYEENEIEFKVHCSKGTYIRSLCEDIAEKLGTCGYMKELKRINLDKFKIEDAIKIDELEKNKDDEEFLKKHLITIENLFSDKEKIVLDNKKLKLFLNGVVIDNVLENGLYRIYSDNIFIGTGVVLNNKLKRDIIENE